MIQPETIVGVATSIIGTAGAYLIARYQARKADQMGDKETQLKFAGELSTDNSLLRDEVRVLRVELRASELRVRTLEGYIILTLKAALP